jgi:superfamily II DNA or RNA helicase
MEIVIENKIRLKQAPSELTQRLITELRLKNPKYEEAIRVGRSTWKINPFINNFDILPDDSLRIPRGYRQKLFKAMFEMGITGNVTDKRPKIEPYYTINSNRIRYRPYQYDAVMSMTKHDEGVLVAPAGSGKTVLGISMLPLYGLPMLWLTHTGPLAEQVVDRINFFLPSLTEDDIGIIGGGKWKIGNLFTVGMVQTLVRRIPQLHKIQNEFGILILDEAHHCPASTFMKVIGCFNPIKMYGLTATPYRRDSLQALMFQTLGDEIVRIPIEEVEKYGGAMRPTVKYKAFKHPHHIEDANTNRIMTNNIMVNDRRNHMIVGDVLREAAQDNICIVVSNRKKHCEILYDLLSIGWDKTGIATGDYNKKYVSEQIERLNSGEITVLVCTDQLLGEGFDYAPLNRAFLGAPFRSEAKCEQIIGRIQRPAPGKKDALVYDYVDINIGVIQNQFYSRTGPCRYAAYERLGVNVEPY